MHGDAGIVRDHLIETERRWRDDSKEVRRNMDFLEEVCTQCESKVKALELRNAKLHERVRELEEQTRRQANLMSTVSELKVTNEWEHTEMQKKMRLIEGKLEKLTKLERKVEQIEEKIEEVDDRAREDLQFVEGKLKEETEDLRKGAYNAALSFYRLIQNTQDQCKRASEDMKQFVEEHVNVDKAFKKHYQGTLPETLMKRQGDTQE